MSKLHVESFTISINGFGAGPNQNLDTPLGSSGLGLYQWAFLTNTFQKVFGNDSGTTGIDNRHYGTTLSDRWRIYSELILVVDGGITVNRSVDKLNHAGSLK